MMILGDACMYNFCEIIEDDIQISNIVCLKQVWRTNEQYSYLSMPRPNWGLIFISCKEAIFADVDGILVPGGFGSRGIEGKILACNYARTHGIPYLGICLGMQIANIEFARNVLGLDGANSAEINPDTRYPVIDILPEKKSITDLGGTLRLGEYPCKLNKSSKAYELYGEETIYERHRHRYEVNNDYRDRLLEGGMIFAGTSPDDHIVEMVEIPEHPWFVAGQFHPEFKSRPNRPHPLFVGFVGSALKHSGKTK